MIGVGPGRGRIRTGSHGYDAMGYSHSTKTKTNIHTYLYTREYLLCKGKYHLSADLLFDLFGFRQIGKYVDNFSITQRLNPNQLNRKRSVVQ